MTLYKNVGLLCALLALASTTDAQSTQSASLPRPTLLAFGSSNHYWIATIESYKEGNKTLYKTLVREQTLPAGDWKDMGVPVLGYAAGLAESQGQLAVLMEDASWKFLDSSGLTTGPDLPGTGPVLAWGSASSTLYAIRAVEGGKQAIVNPDDNGQVDRPPTPATTSRPTTRPTTAKAATTTSATTTTRSSISATTRPATLVLLRYERGQWHGAADLPASIRSNLVSISGVGNKLLLAEAGAGDLVRAWALTDSKWEGWGEFHAGSHPGDLGAMALGHVPALWTKDQDKGVKVFVKREGEEWSSLKTFELPKALPASAQRTVAAAGDDIRLVAMGKDGKIWEQRYDSTGAKRGDFAPLPTPQVEHESPMVRVLQMMVLLAMVVVMLVTFYKRRTPGPKDEGREG
jgi:hypothetical protein